jgi:hypothetical protein
MHGDDFQIMRPVPEPHDALPPIRPPLSALTRHPPRRAVHVRDDAPRHRRRRAGSALWTWRCEPHRRKYAPSVDDRDDRTQAGESQPRGSSLSTRTYNTHTACIDEHAHAHAHTLRRLHRMNFFFSRPLPQWHLYSRRYRGIVPETRGRPCRVTVALRERRSRLQHLFFVRLSFHSPPPPLCRKARLRRRRGRRRGSGRRPPGWAGWCTRSCSSEMSFGQRDGEMERMQKGVAALTCLGRAWSQCAKGGSMGSLFLSLCVYFGVSTACGAV